MTNLAEFDKLEIYLRAKGYDIQRVDTDAVYDDLRCLIIGQHQIFVYRGDRVDWSASCQMGSAGYDEGLIQVCGNICRQIKPDSNAMSIGWLTADDIIRALEGQHDKS